MTYFSITVKIQIHLIKICLLIKKHLYAIKTYKFNCVELSYLQFLPSQNFPSDLDSIYREDHDLVELPLLPVIPTEQPGLFRYANEENQDTKRTETLLQYIHDHLPHHLNMTVRYHVALDHVVLDESSALGSNHLHDLVALREELANVRRTLQERCGVAVDRQTVAQALQYEHRKTGSVDGRMVKAFQDSQAN